MGVVDGEKGRRTSVSSGSRVMGKSVGERPEHQSREVGGRGFREEPSGLLLREDHRVVTLRGLIMVAICTKIFGGFHETFQK